MFCLGHGGEKLDSIGDVVQKSLFVGNGSSSHLPFRENVRRGIFSDVTRCSFHDAGNSRPRKHGYVSHTKRYGYVSHTTSHSSRCTSRSFGLRLCRRNTPHLLQRPSSTTRRIPHVLGRTKSPTKLHSRLSPVIAPKWRYIRRRDGRPLRMTLDKLTNFYLGKCFLCPSKGQMLQKFMTCS